MVNGRILILTVAVLMGGSSNAFAAPSSTQHDATSASLRDAAGDVLLSDGNPVYVGRELASRIVDFSDPATPDRFHFQPGHKRSVQISHSSIDGGIPVPCAFTFIVFTSSTTPNWFEVLRGGSQPNVLSDASFLCHADSVGNTGRRFLVTYPDGSEECAVIEGGPLTWRFTAPSGCPATVTAIAKHHGKTNISEQSGVSAPMQIAISIAPDGF